jgi:hypothetical protein
MYKKLSEENDKLVDDFEFLVNEIKDDIETVDTSFAFLSKENKMEVINNMSNARDYIGRAAKVK